MIINFKNLVWGVKAVYSICGAAAYILLWPAMAICLTKDYEFKGQTIMVTANSNLSEASIEVLDSFVPDEGEQRTLKTVKSSVIEKEDVTVEEIPVELRGNFTALSANSLYQSEKKEMEANFNPTNTLLAQSVSTRINPSEALEIIRRRQQSKRFQSSLNNNPMSQIPNVSDLQDVAPGDWAYEALKSLVERYGCIVGYPDTTFRGNRALSRYEFAAGLNACMQQMERLLAASEAVIREDIEKLKRLMKEFEAEMVALGAKVDNLEGRVAYLEDHQFSTTAWLNGTTVLGWATAGGGEPPGRGETNATLNYLTFLNLSASFTGSDVLRIGLSAGNFDNGLFANPRALNTRMALLSYQTDTDNQLEVSSLEYRFTLGDRLGIVVKPVGFSLATSLDTLSPNQSSVQGALSRFAAYSPIFRIGSLDGGVGLDFLLTEKVQLKLAYGTRNTNDPNQGLFDSDNQSWGVQFLFFNTRESTFKTAITYVNAYSSKGRLDTFTGSNNADISGGFDEPATIHAVNGSLEWQLTPNFTFATWGGFTLTDSRESDARAFSTTYLFSLGLRDPFGREGDLMAFMVGQPPRLRYGTNILQKDEGSSMHYELFYRLWLNDQISITPGVFFVTDPGHISENDDIFVGAIRTTFSF